MMESIFEKFAIAAFLPGAIFFFITIHVLHFAELEGNRFNGGYQFWPFYDEMSRQGQARFKGHHDALLFVTVTLKVLNFIDNCL